MTQHSSNKIPPIPPEMEYEKEIRELYRERNAKQFSTPTGKLHKPRGWHFELLIAVILAAIVSTLASVSLISFLQPIVSVTKYEKSPTSVSYTPEISEELKHSLAPAVVSIFVSHPTSVAPIDKLYLTREALGQGLVLSSDGWIVTTQAVVSDAKRSYQIASADGAMHPVQMIVIDPAVPVTYLKIEASNLSATAFAEFNSLAIGQPVVIGAFSTQSVNPAIYLRRLTHLSARIINSRADVVASSDVIPDRYLFDQPLPAGTLGAPVANLRGEIIGLVGEYGGEARVIIPLDSLNSIIDMLFAKNEVHRASLGLSYLQSEWTELFLPADDKLGQGATITSSAKRVALSAKGAAALAGFKEGDRIISIGSDRLGVRSLSSLLQQYRPGDRLEFLVERQGKEIKLLVTLGNAASKGISLVSPKK
jgi:S1-C subfamily serine protease